VNPLTDAIATQEQGTPDQTAEGPGMNEPAMNDPSMNDAGGPVFGTTPLAMAAAIAELCGLLYTFRRLGSADEGELAERAGLQPRYVREWLRVMHISGLVDFDAERRCYSLSADQAQRIAEYAGHRHLDDLAQHTPLLALLRDEVVSCFRNGPTPRPYSRFHPALEWAASAEHAGRTPRPTA
jgi:hypothetical protein